MNKIADFTHQDVQGKKFREQYFYHILLVIYFAAGVLLISKLGDPEALESTLLTCLIFLVISIPFVILSILNLFCIGRVLCVLAEDRLFFFHASLIVKKKHNCLTGYLLCSAIQEVQYFRRGWNRASSVVISGEDFQVTIQGGGRRLVKALEKVRPALGKGSADEALFLCVPEDDTVRTGLFKEIWEAYDDGSLLTIFDEKTEITYAEDQGDMITIVLQRNGNIVEFDLDGESVYLFSNQNQLDETRMFEEKTTLQDVCDWMNEFLLKNT